MCFGEVKRGGYATENETWVKILKDDETLLKMLAMMKLAITYLHYHYLAAKKVAN